MGVTLEFRSSAAKVLRDQGKIIDQVEKMTKGYKETAKEAGQLDRAAQRLNKQLEGPQERHNRKLQELATLQKTGRINTDQMRRAVELYNRELVEAEHQGDRAFGPSALGKVAKLAGAFGTVGGAVALVTQQLREFVRERDEAADRTLASRRAMAGLAQMFIGDPAGFAASQVEARGMFAAGATDSLSEAGPMLFSLRSAGADQNDRNAFIDLAARGVIAEPGEFAKSARALQSAMGEQETGSFREILSKAFAASAASPSTAEQILQGAAAAGPGARTLGLSDEQVLAATAVLAEPTGSASQAGTMLRSLFKNMERGGLSGDLPQMLATIQGRLGAGADFGDIFGGQNDQEAIDAFRILQLNKGKLGDVTASVGGAVAGDFVGQAMALPDTDPLLRSARIRQAAEQGLQVRQEGRFGEATNLLRAVEADYAGATQDFNPLARALDRIIVRLGVFGDRLLLDDATVLRNLSGQVGIQDPDLRQTVEAFLKKVDEQTEVLKGIQQKQTGRPPVTRIEGRQE